MPITPDVRDRTIVSIRKRELLVFQKFDNRRERLDGMIKRGRGDIQFVDIIIFSFRGRLIKDF